MKWVMIIIFVWGRAPAMDQVEGFRDRKDCLLASQEMRVSIKNQIGSYGGGPYVLTYCMKVKEKTS